MSNNDFEPRHLETLDRDLGRLSNLEVATAFVGRPLVGPHDLISPVRTMARRFGAKLVAA